MHNIKEHIKQIVSLTPESILLFSLLWSLVTLNDLEKAALSLAFMLVFIIMQMSFFFTITAEILARSLANFHCK